MNEVELLKNEINNLKDTIQNQLQQLNAKDLEIINLQDLLSRFKRKTFGASSEKVNSEQLGLFNEAETESLEPEPVEDEEKIIIPAHERKARGKRSKLPENLPREVVVIDLENKFCSIDGTELKLMGTEESEKLEIIPAKIKVIKTIRNKYSCPCCEAVTEAKAAEAIIPKSIASSSLLSYIAVSKYVDSLPLYRQEAMFKRLNIEIPGQTMARWMIRIGEKIDPLMTLLREELLKEKYLFMDETTIQVLEEENKKAQTKSYMWVQARAGINPIIIYHYAKDRSAANPLKLLEDFKGALQVDGYDGYQAACDKYGITRLGCFAHARRKFFDAFKSSSGSKVGARALKFIKDLYKIEDEIENYTAELKFITRLTKSIPLLKEFKLWVDDQLPKTTPSSMAGKALNYINNEWIFLMNCFSDGNYRIDNNYIESKIRPFTIGRKNWLFSVTPDGATASANLYSLVQTAIANKLDPYEYLKNVFEKLPIAQTEKDFLDLLPVKVKF